MEGLLSMEPTLSSLHELVSHSLHLLYITCLKYTYKTYRKKYFELLDLAKRIG